MAIDLDLLRDLQPISEQEIANIKNRFETQVPLFIAEPDYMAVLAFGGTIQSAYVPADENIKPIPMNPVLERTIELGEKFGIADKSITGSILITKDSREIVNADIVNLIYTIRQIPNRRIVVSCGTYMLPIVAQALNMHFADGKSEKIIGVTGSWLPQATAGQDVDYNSGAVIAAINAFDTAKQKGVVFVQFHARIIVGGDLAKINLHLAGVNPRLARALVTTSQ